MISEASDKASPSELIELLETCKPQYSTFDGRHICIFFAPELPEDHPLHGERCEVIEETAIVEARGSAYSEIRAPRGVRRGRRRAPQHRRASVRRSPCPYFNPDGEHCRWYHEHVELNRSVGARITTVTINGERHRGWLATRL